MSKTFIIAEVGINHNGRIDYAKKLIKIAKECGCDAVKFQKRAIDKVYTKDELDKYRESPWGTTNRQQKEGLELSKDEYDVINAYCKIWDIPWFASAWDLESQKFLQQYDLQFNKVASAMLTHKELLKMIAQEKKYTFISTGMSNLTEIRDAVDLFEHYNCPYELMHCNSEYPMPADKANLKCISMLRTTFDCKVGYSGHEVGLIPTVAAVVLGATSVERHITLNRSMYGSDQASSIEPGGFKRLVDYIREVESALGSGSKIVTEAEEKCKAKLRRTCDL
jgi:N-acetylneuraminate synthase